MKTEFLADMHVRKALHTLQGAIEASAKRHGTNMMFLYVVAGCDNREVGVAAVGFVNDASGQIASNHLQIAAMQGEVPPATKPRVI